MTSCVFATAILFALNLVLFSCDGWITSPPHGTRLTVLPGSTEKIKWTFDDDISTVEDRAWYFTSSNTSRTERLAVIVRDNDPVVTNSSLLRVYIEKPATLVLKDVDLSYNGTFAFYLGSAKGGYLSVVVVYIPEKPTVIVCSSSTTINEGDDFTCACRSKRRNPPANVTWYKDGVQIGRTGIEQKLALSNVDGADSGIYTCVAQSHTLADENSIKVKVRLNFKPNKTAITLSDTAVLGKTVTITCESDGLPEPSYTITHNDTVVSTEKIHTIMEVKWSDAGLYQCIAVNKLGGNSKSYRLAVVGEITACKKMDCQSSANTVVVWHIVVTLVSGIIIGILFSYIVWCSRRRWFRTRKPERNPEAQTTEADPTYQELDLTEMSKEDNYESLRVNAASNDEEATYTELNKIRDVESNYQSLT